MIRTTDKFAVLLIWMSFYVAKVDPCTGISAAHRADIAALFLAAGWLVFLVGAMFGDKK